MPMKKKWSGFHSPPGRQEKVWFSEGSFGAPNPPTDCRKAELTGLFRDVQVLAPRVSLGACESLAAGQGGGAGPGALLCIASCACALWGDKWSVHSAVRAALLTCTESISSEGTHLCPAHRAHHRFIPDRWRMQGNFHLEMIFPPGLSHYLWGGGAGSGEQVPHILQEGSFCSG